MDAIEQLAVLAVVTEADEAGRLDDLEDDLFRFGRVLGTQPELRAALGNPFAPADAKRQLIDTLLADKTSPQTVQLVTQAALQPRGRSLDRTLEQYAALAAEQRERLVAEVRVANELSAEQRRRLVDRAEPGLRARRAPQPGNRHAGHRRDDRPYRRRAGRRQRRQPPGAGAARAHRLSTG